MTETTTPPLDTIRQTLGTYGQSHLLTYYDELAADAQAGLLSQIASFDFAALAPHLRGEVADEAAPTAETLTPAPCFPLDGSGWNPEAAHRAGTELLAAGKIAAFTVAGGQGTRLGWNGPKGSYPATPLTGKPLFRVFAEQILAAQNTWGATIPWYIMTSPINDAATRAFFLDNNCFGLRRSDVFMFPQGVSPSFDPTTGRILLEGKGEVAVNPDGHGGSVRALAASGALEDMAARGVEHISYFQVDNPLVSVMDPTFIGVHVASDDSSGEMSSKMVAKANAAEKVGVFCRRGGRTVVVEYSDLPDALSEATNDDGSLRFAAGSIAIHLLSVAFVKRLTGGDSFALPFHRALKKVAYLDLDTGNVVEPAEPNAIKLETFVFDALDFAKASIVLETDRADEFAPIKNASGNDSPATSHRLQSNRAGRWLTAAGVTVPLDNEGHADAMLEVSPLTALDASQLVGHEDLPGSVGRGEELAI